MLEAESDLEVRQLHISELEVNLAEMQGRLDEAITFRDAATRRNRESRTELAEAQESISELQAAATKHATTRSRLQGRVDDLVVTWWRICKACRWSWTSSGRREAFNPL